MRKIQKPLVLISMMLTLFFVGACFAFPLNAVAGPELIMVEGTNYNVNSTLAENLKTLMGKKVYVTLNCGKVFAGYVKDVGDHLLHLEKIEGKDYFDALIPIDRISAMDTRFRQPKR